MDGNHNVKHRAVIVLYAEVHEVLPTGDCRGVPVHKARQALTLDGMDKNTTIRKLNELIQELQTTCQSQH